MKSTPTLNLNFPAKNGIIENLISEQKSGFCHSVLRYLSFDASIIIDENVELLSGHTVFENHQKCRILILAFSTNF